MSQALAERLVPGSRLRWERMALVALLVSQVALALVLPVAGRFLIDEVVYTEMTRSLTEGYGFFIDNGYEQVPSPELVTTHMKITTEGRIAGQYPVGLPLIAAPSYELLGVRGIMLINATALVGVIAFTYLLVRHLLGDCRVAAISAVVLLGATYLWEYSIAIWPQVLVLALGLGAILTMLKGVDGPDHRMAIFGGISGLLFGLAVLTRYDAIILVPAIALCLYGRRPAWNRVAPAFLVGCIPALAVMSWSNYVRWDTPLPFSYGGTGTRWLIPIIISGAGVVALIGLAIYAWRRFPAVPKMSLPVIGVVIGAVIMAIPNTRNLIIDSFTGAWTLVVDLRQYPRVEQPALQRLPDGTLLYANTVKKSLVQSLPYLAVIALPIATAWRSKRRAILVLTTPIVLFIGFYAPRAWHGGLAFNLRYFLPVLPFAAILTAWALRIVIDRAQLTAEVGRIVRTVAIATLTLFAVGRVLLSSVEDSAWFFSVPPLFIAAATAIAVMAVIVRPSPNAARVTLALCLVGLTWAGAVAYGYDAATTLNVRHSHAETSAAIADFIEDDSLLIADWPDNVYGVKDHREDVVIALPTNDDYATLDSLLAHFGSTRAVFGAMTAESWEDLPGPSQSDWIEIGEVGNYSIRRLAETPSSLSLPTTQGAS